MRRNVRDSVLGETRAAEASSRIGTGLATPSDQCSRTARIIAITSVGRAAGVRCAGAGSARNVSTSRRSVSQAWTCHPGGHSAPSQSRYWHRAPIGSCLPVRSRTSGQLAGT
ncbi:hypothetical protein [Nonomuraea sp. NPDC049784]|uniref:hypothetical protein n=1 Tax=Nonomuraea sp. NPDC049784 TaxID=3154361 RepID=UPI0033DF158C